MHHTPLVDKKLSGPLHVPHPEEHPPFIRRCEGESISESVVTLGPRAIIISLLTTLNAPSQPILDHPTSYKEKGKRPFPTDGLDILDWVYSYQKKIDLRNIMDGPRMTVESLMDMGMSQNLAGSFIFT